MVNVHISEQRYRELVILESLVKWAADNMTTLRQSMGDLYVVPEEGVHMEVDYLTMDGALRTAEGVGETHYQGFVEALKEAKSSFERGNSNAKQ